MGSYTSGCIASTRQPSLGCALPPWGPCMSQEHVAGGIKAENCIGTPLGSGQALWEDPGGVIAW